MELVGFSATAAEVARTQNPHIPGPFPMTLSGGIDLNADPLWETSSLDKLSIDGDT